MIINIAPAINLYEFPESLAKDLIHMFENDERVSWGESYTGHGDLSEIRTSKQFAFESEMPIAAGRVKEIFIESVNHYADQYSVSVIQDEGLTLLKYDQSEKYDYHADADWSMYRTVSGIIYLNPQDYEGGETHFKLFDLNVKPEKPALVLFPSNYAYIHAAMPVTSGTKYIFVTWMNDMPPGFSTTILRSIANITGK